MNNFVNSPLNNSTPIRRIGLSRKRKSLGVCDSQTAETGSEKKIAKQDVEICDEVGVSGTQEITDGLENVVNNATQDEVNLKCKTGDLKDKTGELESLYLTWKNGCKNAFLYLLDILNKQKSDNVDVKNLLKELGIWTVMSEHFKDDSDLDFLNSDSD